MRLNISSPSALHLILWAGRIIILLHRIQLSIPESDNKANIILNTTPYFFFNIRIYPFDIITCPLGIKAKAAGTSSDNFTFYSGKA
jgi:hypothetical protein